ncbi:MAG TPA: hypothetical protein VIL23_00675 [Clostridia bacterium]
MRFYKLLMLSDFKRKKLVNNSLGMKRFLLFLAFILIFAGLGVAEQDLLLLRKKYSDMKVVFFTTDSAQIKSDDCAYNGIYYEVYCDANNAKKVKNALGNIQGMSVSFKGSIKDVDYILELYKVKVVSETRQGQLLCICGYSELIYTPAVKVGDHFVNIQLALRENTVTAGAPLILGSF